MNEQWQTAGLAGRQAWLMARMINRLGLTIADSCRTAPGVPLRWVSRTCVSCTHASECEAWLSYSNVAYAADAPEFCPNARVFRQLRASTSR